MRGLEDSSIDLILTDPPYGILKYGATTIGGGNLAAVNIYPEIDWDEETLSQEQLREIIRVSKNQVIFGANYFSDILPRSQGWMIWDKKRGVPDNHADCELVWTSFDVVPRMFHHRWRGFIRDSEKGNKKWHPTQKPVKLIEWLLKRFSSEYETILDPFLGSGTTMFACQNLRRSCIGVEISPHYCEVVKRRCFHRRFLDREVNYEFSLFTNKGEKDA